MTKIVEKIKQNFWLLVCLVIIAGTIWITFFTNHSCGVKLSGVIVKEFTPNNVTTCEEDRSEFVKKFMAQCYGKTGSDEKDIECGMKL